MKKKKRNFIIKICSLLLLGIISITLLGSWSYDSNNDTIISDNLITLNDIDSTLSNGLTYSVSNDTIYVDGVASSQVVFWISTNDVTNFDGSYYTLCFSYDGSFTPNVSGVNNLRISAYSSINGTELIQTNRLEYNYVNLYSSNHINFLRCQFNTSITCNSLSINVMLYKGRGQIDYEPYGQTYVNQQRLDDLELDYDDLAEQYSNLYDDYETLQNYYNTLQNDYNTLQNSYNAVESAYNQLESDFNTLESNYNDLNSRFSTLTDEYDTLLEEKQELQQQLADLNNELVLLRPYIFNSSDIVVKIGNSTNTGDNFVSTSVVSNVSSYFDVYGSFDFDSLYSNYSGFGSTYNAICFEVPNYNLMMYNISFSFTGFPDMLYRLNYQDSVGNNLVVAQDFTDSYTDLYGFSIVSGLRNSSMWDSSQPIEYCTYSKIVFVGLNTGALNVKKLNFSSSAGYSEGFNQGYNSIKNQTDVIINRLNTQIDTLNSTIDNLHNQITDLQNQLSNSIGWRPLFFAMADTPLKVVSNFLGFELFGINLFQAFIGIITALAIIWLIRKIWK